MGDVKFKQLNPGSSTEALDAHRTTGWFEMSDLGTNVLIRRVNIRYLSGDDIAVDLYVDGDSDSPVRSVTFRANSGVTGATLSEGINASVTTLPTSSTDKLRDGDWIKVGSEIMKVVTYGSTSHTVQRGMRGTTAASHSTSAVISYANYPNDSIRISKRAKYAQVKVTASSSTNNVEINKMEIEYA